MKKIKRKKKILICIKNESFYHLFLIHYRDGRVSKIFVN